MAKQTSITGNCPFCQREVDSDLRPINPSNIDHNLLESDRGDNEPSTSRSAMGNASVPNVDLDVPNNDDTADVSMAVLTNTILNMVKKYFERNLHAEATSEDDTEIILDMLLEEQNAHNRVLKNKATTDSNPK